LTRNFYFRFISEKVYEKEFNCRNRRACSPQLFCSAPIKPRTRNLSYRASAASADAYDSDLHLHENNGTDLTFHNASYQTKDFTENAPYYGARLTYFLSRESHWGFGLEFLHSKVFLDSGESLHVTGTRDGSPVNDTESVGNTIADFHCAHGVNYLTADTFYRFFLGQPDNFIHRFQPYLGAGVGITIPHVVVQLANEPGFEQLRIRRTRHAGHRRLELFDITKHIQLFTEYKFTYADLDKLEFPTASPAAPSALDPMANHLVFGVSYRF
jgi:lipid A oxidase